MSGAILGGGVSTSLSVDGTTYVSGKVQFAAGVGVLNTLTPGNPNQIRQDTLRVDPPEVFSLFTPGVVAAKTLGVWRNTRAAQTALGIALEANLVTAPTAGDVSNYWALQAADGAGHSMQLPISTNGVNHYALNEGSGAVIARPKLGAGSPAGSGTTIMHGLKFQPTQALVVTGLVATLAISNFSDSANYGARTIRASLLDSAGNLITSANGTTTGPTVQDVQVAFPLAIALTSGTTYYATFDIMQSYTAIAGTAGSPSSATDPGVAVDTAFTTQAAPITFPTGNGGVQLTLGGTATRAAINGETPSQAIQARPTGQTLSDGTTPLAAIGLLGNGGAGAFVGDVTLSIVAQGAPAAGAAGSDLNSRILLGAS